jgi:hypothetical protein
MLGPPQYLQFHEETDCAWEMVIPVVAFTASPFPLKSRFISRPAEIVVAITRNTGIHNGTATKGSAKTERTIVIARVCNNLMQGASASPYHYRPGRTVRGFSIGASRQRRLRLRHGSGLPVRVEASFSVSCKDVESSQDSALSVDRCSCGGEYRSARSRPVFSLDS